MTTDSVSGCQTVFKTDHFFAGYYIFSTPFANSTKALSLASCRARSDLLQVSLLDNFIFVIVIFLAPDLSDAYNTFEWPAFCFLLCQKCAPKYPSIKPQFSRQLFSLQNSNCSQQKFGSVNILVLSAETTKRQLPEIYLSVTTLTALLTPHCF